MSDLSIELSTEKSRTFPFKDISLVLNPSDTSQTKQSWNVNSFIVSYKFKNFFSADK